MSGRDAILGKIRKGLGAKDPGAEAGGDTRRREAVARRLAERPRHVTLSRVAGKSPDEHMGLLRSYLESQSATVLDAATTADVPGLIAGYLRERNLPARLRTGGDPLTGGLAWSSEPTLDVRRGAAEPSDEVGLAHALAGVAETGTLVLPSGADNPVTNNFLPETHIVILRRADVVGAYEDAWARVRAQFPAGAMPRTVNFISGPSRTGDIGGKLVMGAHGPRRLCVIVVAG